jgi:RNA-directed DNA polymerase
MNDQYDIINHGPNGEGSTGSVGFEAQQTFSAVKGITDFSNNQSLMEQISSIRNLKIAFKRVKRNKGAPGVDRISISSFEQNLDTNLVEIKTKLLNQRFRPLPVRGVNIPKPDGGIRQLGIPVVIDRTVQQAIAQVLSAIVDPTFSESSYGFRPKRSAIMALKQARKYVADGRRWVVDIDLEKFFDRVNHDVLMNRVAKRIQDKQLLKLIRKFLTAGMMQDGVCSKREEGTPQGGPLSPLLSNILLDDLDKELERRGHLFCRYADDCNIYVQSQKAGRRVMKSVTNFLEKRLKLKVNKSKSAVDTVKHRKFLGYRIQNIATLSIAPESLKRAKDKIRKLSKRNRGVSVERVIKELNSMLLGWFHYFKWSEAKSLFRNLDAWIRRRVRCYRLKQRKRKYSIMTFLRKQGVSLRNSWRLAISDKGWWSKAFNPIVHTALSKEDLKRMGLISLSELFDKHRTETAVCDIACTVV